MWAVLDEWLLPALLRQMLDCRSSLHGNRRACTPTVRIPFHQAKLASFSQENRSSTHLYLEFHFMVHLYMPCLTKAIAAVSRGFFIARQLLNTACSDDPGHLSRSNLLLSGPKMNFLYCPDPFKPESLEQRSPHKSSSRCRSHDQFCLSMSSLDVSTGRHM